MRRVVAHIGLDQGRAELKKLLLHTRNITIAGSGILPLDDTGTGVANPCAAAVEETRTACGDANNMKAVPD